MSSTSSSLPQSDRSAPQTPPQPTMTRTTTALLQALSCDSSCSGVGSRNGSLPAGRSKMLPDRVVRNVLLNSNKSNGDSDTLIVDDVELRVSYCSLLSKYLGSIKTEFGTGTASGRRSNQNDNNNKSNISSYHVRITVVFRFLQLLLEYNLKETRGDGSNVVAAAVVANDENDDNYHCQQPRSSSSSSSLAVPVPTKSPGSSQDRNNMIRQLLNGLTGVVCTCLLSSSSSPSTLSRSAVSGVAEKTQEAVENSAASSSSNDDDAYKICCFVVSCLLQLDGHYGRSQPLITVPLWKGLVDMFAATTAATAAGAETNSSNTASTSSNNDDLDKDNNNNLNAALINGVVHRRRFLLPDELYAQAVQNLSEYLLEGCRTILRLAASTAMMTTASMQQQQQQQQAFSLKLLSFFVQRLGILLKERALSSSSGANGEGGSATIADNATMTSVYAALYLVRGLPEAIQQALPHHQSDGNNNIGNDSSDDNNSVGRYKSKDFLLKPYVTLANKIEKCVISWVFNGGSNGSQCNNIGNAYDSSRTSTLCSPLREKRDSHIHMMMRACDTDFSFLVMQQQKKPSELNANDFAFRACRAGKALLLVRILERFVANGGHGGLVQNGAVSSSNSKSQTPRRWKLSSGDVDLVLHICKNLLFVALPACYESGIGVLSSSSSHDSSSCGNNALTTMSRACSAVATAMRICHEACTSHRTRCHRLYLSWLQPPSMPGNTGKMRSKKHLLPHQQQEESPLLQHHPLARELVFTVLYLLVCSLARTKVSSSSYCRGKKNEELVAVASFLQLLVKLLFDKRTCHDLRKNVASLTTRLLGTPQRELREYIQTIIFSEYKTLEWDIRKRLVREKKRRRRHKKQKRLQESDDIRTAGGSSPQLSVKDIMLVCQVLSSLPDPIPISENMASFMVSEDKKQFVKSSAGCAAVLLYAIVSDHNNNKTLLSWSREDNKTNTSMAQYFIEEWNSCRRRRENGNCSRSRWDYLAAFGSVLCRRLYAGFDGSNDDCSEAKQQKTFSNDQLHQVCQLLQICTDPALLERTNLEGPSLSSSSLLLFEAARLCGVVSKVLSPETPAKRVQEITAVFYRLLNTGKWYLTSTAMTSFVSFASKLPAVHKTLLPTAVPVETQKLLQSRLQQHHQKHTSLSHDRIQMLQLAIAKAFAKMTISLDGTLLSPGGSIFPPPTASVALAAGSYFMTMPTVDGRNAIVVFPPGQQSLDDIECMWGANNQDIAEKPVVRTVHRCAVTKRGGLLLVAAAQQKK